MGIRKYKPTSAGRRDASVSDFKELTKGAKPEKSLLKPLRKKGGRNNQGIITCRHRGGGHKRKYRVIDFRRAKDGVQALVDSIQYDPNRSARIALLHYAVGEKRYIIAPDGLKKGDTVESGPDAPPVVGNCMPLRNVPLSTVIHNIELRPGQGAVLCRSAGTNATLMARDSDWAQISLPSGETVVTLTWWSSHDGVTYEAAQHSVDEHVTPITYVATAQTVSADKSFPIPAELVGAKFLKVVGDVAATIHVSLKSS